MVRSTRVSILSLLVTIAVAVGVATTAPIAHGSPRLSVSTVLSGLTIPWAIAVAPDGTALMTVRSGGFVAVRPDGSIHRPRADFTNLFVVKEAGLMGLAIDPGFATNRRFYTCQAEARPGTPSVPSGSADLPLPVPSTGQVVNVVAWRMTGDWASAARERTVLTGIPVTATGRHTGCGLAADRNTLWVSTGDTATPTVPQSRQSLGGKVLHITTTEGRAGTPARGNPDPRSPIYTLGHRNVQGVAVQPGTGRVYAIEQGTDHDDELNLLRAGGNYGYRPDRAPLIYDESVPMTDQVRVPGSIGAVWRSGSSTIATPALAFLPGSGWGPYGGGLVVSALKGKRLVFLRLSPDGRHVSSSTEELIGRYGRLRGLAVAHDGSLLVTTSDGDSTDRLLRVRWNG